jgi:hypothetical protein
MFAHKMFSVSGACMPGSAYKSTNPEASARRTVLAPEVHDAFEPLSSAVFNGCASGEEQTTGEG